MKIKKAIALMIGLVLIVSLALPGTLAVSADQSAATGTLTLAGGTVSSVPEEKEASTTEGTEAPTTEGTEAPTTEGTEASTTEGTEASTEGTDQTTAPTETEPSAPTEVTEPTQTTLPTEPETPSFAPQAVYDQLMATETLEEFNKLFDALSEEEVESFRTWLTENGRTEALEAHLAELMPASEPAEPPIVSFTNIGPLLAAPVVHAPRAMRAAARAADDNGVVLDKTATANNDGTYTITLEAYATGASSTVVSTDSVDIVLVLDVSGSMDDPISSYDRTKKINALKAAVNSFIDSVNTQSPDSRIAIVKFSGDKTDGMGDDTYTSRGYLYNYSQIVKNLTTVNADGIVTLKQAVSKLSPAGATRSDYGMELAQSIITSAAVANDGRKKVVIMFTDGKPTSFNDFDETVANGAISASKGIKDAGATVYTIGVFNGADGTPVTDTQWDGTTNWGRRYDDTNKYMHLVSSNYQKAESMTKGDTPTYPTGNKSYYLTPANSSELGSIFTQITQEVGGSTVTLDSKSYIQDTVTGQFTMPESANAVSFYTMECNGDHAFDEDTKAEASGVTYEINDNTLTVTGFDFSGNWCGSHNGTYSGKKLIVEFTVTRREGFLGGNNVSTNEEATDGIYNSEGASLGKFTSPSVNVPIGEVTVTPTEKNVYLLNGVTADQLKSDATVKVGGVTLDLSKASNANKPYGLEKWQTEYVNITVTVTDEDGKEIPTDGLTSLSDDTEYNITVKVTPNEQRLPESSGKAATEEIGEGNGKINVFKPELTFQDSTAYYGETVPNDFSNTNKVGAEKWKHNSIEAVPGDMLGTVPTLDLSYTPDASKLGNNTYTNQDVPVSVKVKIWNTDVTGFTSFVHHNCEVDGCDFDLENLEQGDNSKFLIHIQSCTLTIEKKGWDTIDENQSFMFDVTHPDGKVTRVVIAMDENAGDSKSMTIKGLKIGKYTVTEVTNWSWRYKPTDGKVTQTIELKPTGNTVIFTNKREQNKWLGGDAYNQNKFESGNSN